MRSRLMLEVASELVAQGDWPEKQVRIQMREQGNDEWTICLFGSDAPNAVNAVVRGEADIAILNPGGVLAMALKGTGPFKEPVPVRAIMVLPQFDQLGFAVMANTGLTSLGDIRDRRYPLKLSLRGQRDHSIHLMVNLVLSMYGFSLDDIVAWGGVVTYDEGLPMAPGRIGAARRGDVEAIWDEGIGGFVGPALELGMRFLPVDEPVLQQLEAMGIPRVPITRRQYPTLPVEEIWSVNFSGWPVFCLDRTPDRIVTAYCTALEARKDRIPWYGPGPMRLDLMVSNTPEAPVTIPFHPAAEAFWRKQGYLR